MTLETASAATADVPDTKKPPIGVTVARILLGLFLLATGTGGVLTLLHVMTAPEPVMPPGALAFNAALADTGYMKPMIMGLQIVVGLLLLFNRYVPLALTLLAPLLVNILLFHIFLQPVGIVPGAVCTVLEVYLAWSYREGFAGMLAGKAVAR